MKAIILSRVSTDNQSLDEQSEQLISYAISKGYSKDNLIIISDKEKFEIIHQQINHITLQNDSNTSKLVNIYYMNGNVEQYRFCFKKKPKYFEKNTTYIYKGELPAIWQRFKIEYQERFTRGAK